MKKIIYNMLLFLCELLAELEFRVWADSPAVPQYFRKVYLRLKGVIFAGRIFIGRSFVLRCRGNLVIGDRCSFGSYAKIYNHGPITIGDDFISAAGLSINSGSHELESMEPFVKEIIIGNRVWCGMNVTILPGVRIGDDVVIGACSVVTKDIPSNSVVVGVPARIIGAINRSVHDKYWTPNWC